ncbi:MAG: hypothetical protein WDZ72_08895 [Cyclobacteriaceae bacterium]
MANIVERIGGGADFLVLPTFLPFHVPNCNRNDVLWVPGCGTAVEHFNNLWIKEGDFGTLKNYI